MLARRAPLRFALASLFALCLIACDGEEGMEDGGTAGGDGGLDGGTPLVCESTTVLEGVLDDTVDVTFDTSMTGKLPQDLGTRCGNPDPEVPWAPQEVVEFRVPGEEPVSVEFTTINAETTENMVVYVQARTEACDAIQASRFPPVCWGPVAPSPPAMPDSAEWRSTGQLVANGGDTIYFFVTGFAEPPTGLTDRGTVRFEVTTRLNQAPTLERALVILDGEDVRVEASGADANANARGVLLNLYDSSGALLDIFGDGTATLEDSVVNIRFDDPVSTGFDWTGGAWLRSDPTDMATQLGEYIVANDVTMAMVRAYDAPNGISEGMMVPIQEATIVGFGEACSDVMRCRPEMVCDATSMTCGPSAVVQSRCDNAIDAALPAFTDTAVSVVVSGTLRGMPADFEPMAGCVPPGGAEGSEVVYAIDTPATFDLLLDTARPATGETDTVLYVRGGCFDRGAEAACNNDAGGGVGSQIELRDLPGGGYFIYLEELRQMDPTGDGNYELEITARPVLGTGASCDPAEVMNRCAAGACAGGTCP